MTTIFTVPNALNSDGTPNPNIAAIDQPMPDAVDFSALAVGSANTGVVAGCAVTSNAADGVLISTGLVRTTNANGFLQEYRINASNLTLPSGVGPQFYVIYAKKDGTCGSLTGGVGASPTFPSYSALLATTNFACVLAAVYRPASPSVPVITAHIVSKRVMLAIMSYIDIDVHLFGAVGDDNANDGPAVAAWVAQCQALGRSGTAAGTFRMRSAGAGTPVLLSTDRTDNAKSACACATTVNITLSGEQTIDGILTAASRVLVKNQTTAAQNGIYVSAAGAWARATDLNDSVEFNNAAVSVTAGTTNGGQRFVQTTLNPTVGTTTISWTSYLTSVAATGDLTIRGAGQGGCTFRWSDAVGYDKWGMPNRMWAATGCEKGQSVSISGISIRGSGGATGANVTPLSKGVGVGLMVPNRGKYRDYSITNCFIGQLHDGLSNCGFYVASKVPGAVYMVVQTDISPDPTTTIYAPGTAEHGQTVASFLVGKMVIGDGIPDNTTITAINTVGAEIRISISNNIKSGAPSTGWSTDALVQWPTAANNPPIQQNTDHFESSGNIDSCAHGIYVKNNSKSLGSGGTLDFNYGKTEIGQCQISGFTMAENGWLGDTTLHAMHIANCPISWKKEGTNGVFPSQTNFLSNVKFERAKSEGCGNWVFYDMSGLSNIWKIFGELEVHGVEANGQKTHKPISNINDHTYRPYTGAATRATTTVSFDGVPTLTTAITVDTSVGAGGTGPHGLVVGEHIATASVPLVTTGAGTSNATANTITIPYAAGNPQLTSIHVGMSISGNTLNIPNKSYIATITNNGTASIITLAAPNAITANGTGVATVQDATFVDCAVIASVPTSTTFVAYVGAQTRTITVAAFISGATDLTCTSSVNVHTSDIGSRIRNTAHVPSPTVNTVIDNIDFKTQKITLEQPTTGAGGGTATAEAITLFLDDRATAQRISWGVIGCFRVGTMKQNQGMIFDVQADPTTEQIASEMRWDCYDFEGNDFQIISDNGNMPSISCRNTGSPPNARGMSTGFRRVKADYELAQVASAFAIGDLLEVFDTGGRRPRGTGLASAQASKAPHGGVARQAGNPTTTVKVTLNAIPTVTVARPYACCQMTGGNWARATSEGGGLNCEDSVGATKTLVPSSLSIGKVMGWDELSPGLLSFGYTYATSSGSTGKQKVDAQLEWPKTTIGNATSTIVYYTGGIDPNSAVTAVPGTLCVAVFGGVGSLWLKATGTGNTGWIKHVSTTGDETVAGIKTFSSDLRLPPGDPELAESAVNRGFLDLVQRTTATTGTITENDDILYVSAVATITLPDATDVLTKYFVIKNTASSGNVTVAALQPPDVPVSQKIDGANTAVLVPNEVLNLISNGTNWRRL